MRLVRKRLMWNQWEVRHVMSFKFRLSGKSTICVRFWDESESCEKGFRSRSFLVANHVGRPVQ